MGRSICRVEGWNVLVLFRWLLLRRRPEAIFFLYQNVRAVGLVPMSFRIEIPLLASRIVIRVENWDDPFGAC